MAVGFRAAGTSGGVGSGTILTLGLPAGTQQGDYLIAFVHSQGSTASVDWTPPSGWTKIGPPFGASSSTQRVTSMFAKFASASEASTFDFTGPVSAVRMVGVVHAYTGVDTTNPVAASSGFIAASATSSTSTSVSSFSGSANLYTIEMSASQYTSPNSYAISTYDGGLTLQSQVFRASGSIQNPPSEDTTVSRTALYIWAGTANSSGLPTHQIATVGAHAQLCAAAISLNAGTNSSVPTVTPSIIGHTTATSSGSGSTLTIDPAYNLVGANVQKDDWMILVLSSASSLPGVKQPTVPGDWVNLVPFGTVGTGTMTFGVWAHKRANGESTYTWNQTTAESQNSYQRLIFVRNADDVGKWITGTTGTRVGSGGTTNTTVPSITTTVDHTLGLLLAGERTVASETDDQVTCTNFAKQWFENNVDHSLFVATKDMMSAGSAGSVTVTYPNSHAQNSIGVEFGIPGIPEESGGPFGLPLKVSDGATLQNAYFQVADGAGGLLSPGGLKVVKTGYTGVTQMLAQSMFYCAHRGGSRDFPEMSLYAYGQSALYGYPAMELSLARTSDGVWFGLHDASLDRTSLGTNGNTLVPSSMTWAQVQAYQILGSNAPSNPSQPARPYMRWEELIDMYYDSHVIFVDPKVAIGNRSELLDMMDALPNSTEKFVGKYYGVAGGVTETSGWNYDCHQRGYKTWGYFYETDSANFATYAPRWDILGMDYNASQTAWNNLAAAAPGKPVMGHICPNAGAVSTAIGKGAVGVMVSGIKDNVPPPIT